MTVWKTQLGLNAEQEKQVRAIMTEREEQWQKDHQKVMHATQANKSALRDEMQKNMQSYRDRLHNVLTPEQQQKALKLREMKSTRKFDEKSNRGRGNGKHEPGMRPVDRRHTSRLILK